MSVLLKAYKTWDLLAVLSSRSESCWIFPLTGSTFADEQVRIMSLTFPGQFCKQEFKYGILNWCINRTCMRFKEYIKHWRIKKVNMTLFKLYFTGKKIRLPDCFQISYRITEYLFYLYPIFYLFFFPKGKFFRIFF